MPTQKNFMAAEEPLLNSQVIEMKGLCLDLLPTADVFENEQISLTWDFPRINDQAYPYPQVPIPQTPRKKAKARAKARDLYYPSPPKITRR